jgi:signal peptidase II
MRTLLEIRSRGRQGFDLLRRLPALRAGVEQRSLNLSGKVKLVLGWLAVILISDQASKLVIERTMPLHHSIPVIDDLFNLTYIRNTGAAFGIFAGSAEIFRRPFLIVVSIVASGFILTMLRRLPNRETGLITALTFILGGAMGNLIDRVVYGEVIDFLDFFWSGYHWPAFNIADSFITVGVTITFFYLIRAKGDDPFARAS